jgi:3-hydroxymyristoyl/3-hydroxydecanoyl-(acyl carrier protein) dehydratase
MADVNNILIMGARAGGYGEGIARAAVSRGAKVFGTTLDPADSREKEFFHSLGASLVPIALKFDSSEREMTMLQLRKIVDWLRANGVERLDAVIHTIAGGFPRHPAVMNTVGDILEGRATFSDLATPVRKEVHYVNAGSYEDSIRGLEQIADHETCFMALTYRGKLPYFISPTKIQLEKIAERMASEGKSTLIAALPEAWTQSSQFFKGIEIGVIGNYLDKLSREPEVSEDIRPLYEEMEKDLSRIEGLDEVFDRIRAFVEGPWRGIGESSGQEEVSALVNSLFKEMRGDGSFMTLRKAVEVISRFAREACGVLVMREFLEKRAFSPGEVRQIHYSDLKGMSPIGKAAKRPPKASAPTIISGKWLRFGKDEIRSVLSMYGENFLFVDEIIMEAGPFHENFMGFGRFEVPTPERNPILKEHFVGLPLFGGHLQMEMAGQVGTFIVRKLIESSNLVPILTGSSFPNLNTMAPPGETLKTRILVRLPERRNLTAQATIENRFATSKGEIRGMLVADRVLRKMLRSF